VLTARHRRCLEGALPVVHGQMHNAGRTGLVHWQSSVRNKVSKLSLIYIIAGAMFVLAIATYYGPGGDKPSDPPNVETKPPK
jgi:hypothetical protein